MKRLLVIFCSVVSLFNYSAEGKQMKSTKYEIDMTSWDGLALPSSFHLNLNIDGKKVFDSLVKKDSFAKDKVLKLCSFESDKEKFHLKLSIAEQKLQKEFEVEKKSGSKITIGWENTGEIATALYIRQQ